MVLGVEELPPAPFLMQKVGWRKFSLQDNTMPRLRRTAPAPIRKSSWNVYFRTAVQGFMGPNKLTNGHTEKGNRFLGQHLNWGDKM